MKPSELYRLLLSSSALLASAAAVGCSDSTDTELAQATQAAVTPAGERAFIVRATTALLGRPPLTEQEITDFSASAVGLTDVARTNAILDCMMGSDAFPVCQTARDAFTLHWTHVVMDHFRVSRRSDGQRTVPGCWAQSGLGAPDAATRRQQEGIVRDYLIGSAPNPAQKPPTVTLSNFTMLDVLRGSVQGDMRAALKGNLFAQMKVFDFGAALSETNKRAETYARFASTYLNRDQVCLSCHNTDFSVAGAASDWNRHAPMPHRVEDAVLGCSNGECQEPPDLHADFRHDGFAGTCRASNDVYVIDCDENFPGGEQPWTMSSSCGQFNPPTPNQAPPACPDHSANPNYDPMDSTDPAALLDPCFKDGNEVMRQPRVQFGAPDFDSAATPLLGSTYRLNELFRDGADTLAMTDIGADRTTVRPVPANATARTAAGGGQGFALLTAATFVERVWKEVFGSDLTIALHYPRVGGQNHPSLDTPAGLQSGRLYDLTRGFLQSGWSLRALLGNMLRMPEFNPAARVTGEEYGMDIIFNPWVLHDLRSAPAAQETCTGSAPSFEGCVRKLLYTGRCAECHENPSASPDVRGPPFNHASYADISGRTFGSVQACLDIKNDMNCQAPDDVINCADIFSKPGSRIAVRVACTDPLPSEDQSERTLRMPYGMPPLSEGERDAIIKWVTGNMAMGIVPGYQGTVLGPAPPPPIDPNLPDPMGADLIPVTHNGVGDAVHWKSGFQLTYAMGSALGLEPWQDPFVPGNYLIPSEGQTGGYPSREVAEAAGQYLDDGLSGGRGLSLLELLKWEASHVNTTTSEFCSFGSSGDRLTDGSLITTGASLRTVVESLKQSFMGEGAGTIEVGGEEENLIEAVLGGMSLDDNVTDVAATASALRNVCNVFMKSPLFLLSYVEPTTNTMLEFPGARGGGNSRDDFILPKLCGGRLDCRHVLPLVLSSIAPCWADRRSCSGAGITEGVRTALTNLRLPVEKPLPLLEQALIDRPDLVPSPNDPRLDSSILALPFADGFVAEARGRIEGLFRGRRRTIHRGDRLGFGEVLFIERGAHLSVRVGRDVYSTPRRGMEEPPDFPDGVIDDGPRGRHGRRRRHVDPVWIVLCNGKEGRRSPAPGADPRVTVGTPAGTPGNIPRVGTVPSWAQYGEAGLWYDRL